MSLDIGSRKQLLVDDCVVEEMSGLSRVMHQPEKYAGNPIFRAEKPWERPSVYLYGTVLRGPSTGQFRMWYQTGGTGPEAVAFSCYAVSSDGLNWERPELGVFEYQGGRRNNILLDHNLPSVIHRPDEPDPGRRYRLFVDGEGIRHGGYCTATSSDGVHWSAPRPIYASGDVANFCYDPTSGLYTTFAKLRASNAGFLRRSVCTAQTQDADRWGYFNVTLIPDAEDDRISRERLAARRPQLSLWQPESIHCDFYGLSGFTYEGLFLGMLWVFHISSTEIPPDDGLIDVALVSSRHPSRHSDHPSDHSHHWERLGSREPFIPLGDHGEWDDAMLFTARAPVRVGDELWIYYGGSNLSHGDDAYALPPEEVEAQGKGSAIGLAKLRLDGFVSLDAGPDGGTLLTKPLTFEGDRLRINANAKGGEMRIELVDAETRKPLSGFVMEEFEPFEGDAVEAEVQGRWRCASSLRSVAGRPVCLKFGMRNASLYAFGFGGGQ